MQVMIVGDTSVYHLITYHSKSLYQYGDYFYHYWDDVEEDSVKRFHELYHKDGGYISSIPLSPYTRNMRPQIFKNWIDMGMPTREMMGGHQIIDHEKYHEKWVQEQLEKEFEL